MLERSARIAERGGARVLAFGLDASGGRFLVEGAAPARERWVRGMRSASLRTFRARDRLVDSDRVGRREVRPEGLLEAVAAAHRHPLVDPSVCPLSSPWSSHRDLLGYRRAPFHDGRGLAERLDPLEVHALAGGGPLPRRHHPSGPEALDLLLRLAGAVRGCLPADRACFRLFVHLARRLGTPQILVARALSLTPRRIRQIEQRPEPLVPVGLRCLADPRLRVVP